MPNPLMLAAWDLLSTGPTAAGGQGAPPNAAGHAAAGSEGTGGRTLRPRPSGRRAASFAMSRSGYSRVTERFAVPGLGADAVFEGRVNVQTGLREGQGRVTAGDAIVTTWWASGVPRGLISWADKATGEITVVAGVNEDGLHGKAMERDADGDLRWEGEYACGDRHCDDGTEHLPCGATLRGRWVEGVFCGPDNEYVYPGGRTVLRGSWNADGEMEATRVWQRHLGCWSDASDGGFAGDAAALDDSGQPLERNAAVPHPDVPPDAVFCFDPSDEDTLSRAPSLGDPHERACCYPAASTFRGGGTGLFARVPLAAGLVVSYYNGVRIPSEEANERSWSDNEYTISLYSGEHDASDGEEDTALDVPRGALPWYSATLGHLVNHSDDPNVEFEFCVHPRFGEVKCLRTLRDAPAGAELFADYGYGAFRERTPPPWFEQRDKAAA